MKKLFYFLFALPLMLVACEGAEEEKTSNAVTLEVTSEKEVVFAAEGGEGVITYELSGVEALPTAATEAEWITIAPVAETIAYTVAANTTYEERSATITVSYNDLKAEVTVNQAAAVEPTPESWTIVGSMTNNWNVNNAIELTLEDGFYVIKNFELSTSDVFLFVQGDFVKSIGGSGKALDANYYYNGVENGSNIRVKEAGAYDVYLNEDLTKFYIMTAGKSVTEAQDAAILDIVNWFVVVGETEYKMSKKGEFLVGQNVKFAEDGLFTLCNSKNVCFGSETAGEVGKAISVTKHVESIVVAVETEKVYDVYYRQNDNLVWVVEDGETPVEEIVWTGAEGFFFNGTNFFISLLSQKIKFYFDVNCGVAASNWIIPEGIYYVNNPEEDGGFNFNSQSMVDTGMDQRLIDGWMEVKHISGGYDISVNVKTIYQNEFVCRYVGPVAGVSMMGYAVQNPQ